MSDRKAVLILLVLLTGILALVFGDVFLHPNQYLFGNFGDGIKNYFSFAWYVKFDSGLHFSGMNYPFGEHIVYTDNQPLFSFPLRFVHQYLFPLDKHIIGIVNSIIFLSMLASAVVLYFILKKLLLPAWYAITGAILIVLLSPQHYHIAHQYALTNTLVLPAVWLTIMLVFEAPEKLSRYVWYVLVMLAAGFVHPYFLPMGALLFSGYLIWFLIWKGKKHHWKTKTALLLTAGLPIMLFQVFIYITDQVTDRPVSPAQFLEGKANLAGILYPVGSLAAAFIKEILHLEILPEQNHGYIGVVAIICLALTAIKVTRYLLKGNFKNVFNPVLPRILQMGLWAGLLILIFAMAIPFRFGLMHLLDYLPPLKQFRALNRFVWPYYYIFAAAGIFIIYQVYRLLKIRKKQIWAYGWLTCMLLLWMAEAIILLKVEAGILQKNKFANDFYGENSPHIPALLARANRQVSDFQTIIPFPYYSDGSEKIGNKNWGETMYHSMKTAYQSGIPISTASMARTSLSQVLLRMQLLSSDSIQKDLLPLLPNRKPILIVLTDSATQAYEKRLIQRSKFLIRHKNVSYFELPLDSLENIYREPVRKDQLKPTPIPQNVVYQTFANTNSEKWLYQKGVFSAKTGPVVLYENTLPQASVEITYEFSVWVNATAAISIPVVKLEEINAANQVVNRQTVNLRDATEIYKDWLKVTMHFKLRSKKNRIKITAEGKNIVADELMIRPLKQPFYFYASDRQHLVRNNYRVYQK